MIRNIERKDKENWIKLYCGYAKFYNAKKLYDKIAYNTGFELYELKGD